MPCFIIILKIFATAAVVMTVAVFYCLPDVDIGEVAYFGLFVAVTNDGDDVDAETAGHFVAFHIVVDGELQVL